MDEAGFLYCCGYDCPPSEREQAFGGDSEHREGREGMEESFLLVCDILFANGQKTVD